MKKYLLIALTVFSIFITSFVSLPHPLDWVENNTKMTRMELILEMRKQNEEIEHLLRRIEPYSIHKEDLIFIAYQKSLTTDSINFDLSFFYRDYIVPDTISLTEAESLHPTKIAIGYMEQQLLIAVLERDLKVYDQVYAWMFQQRAEKLYWEHNRAVTKRHGRLYEGHVEEFYTEWQEAIVLGYE
jgi:hypothetical protein